MLSLINCTTYQNFMRFYKMVRLLSLGKNPGMEPVGMILPLTGGVVHECHNYQAAFCALQAVPFAHPLEMIYQISNFVLAVKAGIINKDGMFLQPTSVRRGGRRDRCCSSWPGRTGTASAAPN